MTTEEFSKKLDQVFSYMKTTLEEKNKTYGGASLQGEGIFPILGNYFRQTDKLNRYKYLLTKMLEKGLVSVEDFKATKDEKTHSELNPFEESLWDTVCDIFGYATLGLIILDQQGLSKLPESTEDVSDLELAYAYAQTKMLEEKE